MSNNPFQSPMSKDTTTGSRESVMEKVKAPAIALIVAAVLGMVYSGLSLLMNLLGVGFGAMTAAGTEEGILNLLSGGLGIVINLIGLAVGGVIIYGSMKMMKLESHGLAMAAAIISIIPCVSPCCCIGLPVGIWAIVILSDAQVKASFR